MTLLPAWYDPTFPRLIWMLFGMWTGAVVAVFALALVSMSRDDDWIESSQWRRRR